MRSSRLIIQDDVCEHERLDTNGYCTLCGNFVSSSSLNTSGYKGKTQVEKSIFKDPSLESYSEDLIAKANSIYQLIVSKKMKNKKNELIFWCAFQAHISLGLPVNPYLIARQNHKLNKHKTNKALTYYGSYFNTGQEALVGYVDPMIMVPYYCKHLGISDDVGNWMNENFIRLVESCPNMKHEIKTPLIAAYIYSMLPVYKIVINIEEFSNVFTLSPSTIISAKSKLQQLTGQRK